MEKSWNFIPKFCGNHDLWMIQASSQKANSQYTVELKNDWNSCPTNKELWWPSCNAEAWIKPREYVYWFGKVQPSKATCCCSWGLIDEMIGQVTINGHLLCNCHCLATFCFKITISFLWSKLLLWNFMTTVTQVFFIILCCDVMIPCCYEVTVGGYALDFLKPSILVNFLHLLIAKPKGESKLRNLLVFQSTWNFRLFHRSPWVSQTESSKWRTLS